MEAYAVGCSVGSFERSWERFASVVARLEEPGVGELTHAELEDLLVASSREVFRQLQQDHLDLRAVREERVAQVVGVDGVVRRAVERGHGRGLATVFGQVRVERLGYRARGHTNVYPADGVLSLPVEKHSSGLRRLAAIESARGSFDGAQAAIERGCGVRVGKRQVEALALRAARDVDDFYARAGSGTSPDTDVLVLSADGKGIAMLPAALREATRKVAAKAGNKLATRLSRGEVKGRKRMAEVGAVYDATSVVRTAGDIIPGPGQAREGKPRRPRARDTWLVASVARDMAQVIAAVFDEAERRDPGHRRPWVVLVDGNPHQIGQITGEANRRGVTVTIVIDIVHVLEYLWNAAWCFHDGGDPAAETWVADQARLVLDGHPDTVAAHIADLAAGAALTYLTGKRPYLGYPTALASGWPIATGIIEGACRHLVHDRMGITGARWSLTGAEAILKLRAVTTNGDFDTYWKHHLTQEHQRNHPNTPTRHPHDYTLAA